MEAILNSIRFGPRTRAAAKKAVGEQYSRISNLSAKVHPALHELKATLPLPLPLVVSPLPLDSEALDSDALNTAALESSPPLLDLSKKAEEYTAKIQALIWELELLLIAIDGALERIQASGALQAQAEEQELLAKRDAILNQSLAASGAPELLNAWDTAKGTNVYLLLRFVVFQKPDDKALCALLFFEDFDLNKCFSNHLSSDVERRFVPLLHHLCDSDAFEASLQFLLSLASKHSTRRLDLNTLDTKRRTPLFVAAELGHGKAVRQLLAAVDLGVDAALERLSDQACCFQSLRSSPWLAERKLRATLPPHEVVVLAIEP